MYTAASLQYCTASGTGIVELCHLQPRSQNSGCVGPSGSRPSVRHGSSTVALLPHRKGSAAISYRLRRTPLVFAKGSTADDRDASATGESKTPSKELKNAKEAIAAGQELFAQGQYSEALEIFREVFGLPGSGTMRYKGTVKELSCPSDAEISAALYNIACCHAQMGAVDTALDALDDACKAGFSQFEALSQDPDLAPVRKNPRYSLLLVQYDNPLAKITRARSSVKNENDKKGWLDRW